MRRGRVDPLINPAVSRLVKAQGRCLQHTRQHTRWQKTPMPASTTTPNPIAKTFFISDLLFDRRVSMPLLPYLNERAKDDVRPKQDQKDLENWYVHAEEKPQPPGDGSDSQHRIEAAHLKAIEVPDKVRA